jgi:hypothetical protein
MNAFFSRLPAYVLVKLEDTMSKSALGRGLGHLMKGAKGESPEGEAGSVTSGMAALLRVGNGGPKPETQSPSEAPPNPPEPAVSPVTARRGKWMLRVTLFAADGLLLALAARIVFKSNRPLSFLETALCVIAVMMGAWLSILALCWVFEKKSKV